MPKVKYSGHSLRVGFAVQAYENGASGLHIQQQGGWRTDTMVKRYVRKSDIWRENAAFKLGLWLRCVAQKKSPKYF